MELQSAATVTAAYNFMILRKETLLLGTNCNREKYFRNAVNMGCDCRLARRVTANTNKKRYSLSMLQFRAFTLWPTFRSLVLLLSRCTINVTIIVSPGMFNNVTYAAWNNRVSSPILFLDFFNMFTEFMPTAICYK
jgi:hypothetical protein